MRVTRGMCSVHPFACPAVSHVVVSACHLRLLFGFLFFVICSLALCEQIGPRGAGQLAEALRRNQSLTEIDLRENQLGPKGMKVIADALAHNDTVRALHLQVKYIKESLRLAG